MIYNSPFFSQYYPGFSYYKQNRKTNFNSNQTNKYQKKSYPNPNISNSFINTLDSNNFTHKNSLNSFKSFKFKNFQNNNCDNSDILLEIFGIKLNYDDLLLICLIFFLYTEGVKDDFLFIVLILLLLS